MKRAICIICVSLLASLSASCSEGDGPVRATFRDASDQGDYSSLGHHESIDVDYPHVRGVPQYLARNNRLYLLVQTYWVRWQVVDTVGMQFWTCPEIAQIKASIEARARLPDATAPDGGIAWSKCAQSQHRSRPD